MEFVVGVYSKIYGGLKCWIVERHNHFKSKDEAQKIRKQYLSWGCIARVLTVDEAKNLGWCFSK